MSFLLRFGMGLKSRSLLGGALMLNLCSNGKTLYRLFLGQCFLMTRTRWSSNSMVLACIVAVSLWVINFRDYPHLCPCCLQVGYPFRPGYRLLSHNKLLTRDNLCKRQEIPDKRCLLCCELETCHRLFFECDVIGILWREVGDIVDFPIVLDSYVNVASLWLCNKKRL